MIEAASAELYFAYGANMSAAVMARRGVRPIRSAPALLRGYRLVFDKPGLPLVEPAFANLAADPRGLVHGVVHELSAEALARLDAFEVHPTFGYVGHVVDVERSPSARARAHTYIAPGTRPGLQPSRRYLRLITAAARAAGLPPDYVEELRRQPSAYVPGLSELAGAWITLHDRWNAWLDEVEDPGALRLDHDEERGDPPRRAGG